MGSTKGVKSDWYEENKMWGAAKRFIASCIELFRDVVEETVVLFFISATLCRRFSMYKTFDELQVVENEHKL